MGRIDRVLLAGALLLARTAVAEAPGPSERLSEDLFVRAVLAGNPSVAAMSRAIDAAQARERLARSPADPMLSWEVAPLTVGDRPLAQTVRLEQTVPVGGRLRAAGAAARAETDGARADLETTRQELAFRAAVLFADRVVVERALALNLDHRALIEQIAEAARVTYAAGLAPQGSVIEAEVELARLDAERLLLEAERDRVTARMNGALGRDPRAAFGPLAVEPPAASVAGTRPELDRAEHAVAARESGARVARREPIPDLVLMGTYSTMWMAPEHRPMVGVAVEVPLLQGLRRARIDEADALVAIARAERDRVRDDLAVEETEAAVELATSERVLALHGERVVPLTRERLEAARVAFGAGQVDLAEVLEAERDLLEAELALVNAEADVRRARARWNRAVGANPTGERP